MSASSNAGSSPVRAKRILWVIIGVIGLAAAAQFVPKQTVPHFRAPVELAELAPRSVPGWQAEDRTMGETELVREQVLDILQYEQAFFRTYRSGGTEVGVYVAYWSPEQDMHPANVATHTPDLCWINAGWHEVRHDYALALQDGAGRSLQAAQFREYTAREGAVRQEVVFWHLQGGRLSG
jgi:hypothetical protein